MAVSGGTVVVINTNDSGAGSLRQAMLDAQSAVCTSPCFITFNIPSAPPFVIQPASNLPNVASNTHIDGTTQPGYGSTPIIEIDGSLLVSPSGTLVLSGTNAKLSGLSVTNAVAGSKGISVTGNTNTVNASYIGVAPLGATAANHTGISITGSNNTIGGTNAFDANVDRQQHHQRHRRHRRGRRQQDPRQLHPYNVLLGIDLNADGATPKSPATPTPARTTCRTRPPSPRPRSTAWAG